MFSKKETKSHSSHSQTPSNTKTSTDGVKLEPGTNNQWITSSQTHIRRNELNDQHKRLFRSSLQIAVQ